MTKSWFQPALTLLLALCLWALCFCFYVSFMPSNYTYDGMLFAKTAESPKVELWSLFHPHHLIYNLLGRLVYIWGRSQGALWDGLTALQFFDILTGCLGVVAAFHLMVRLTGHRPVAALTALGLAFTHSYWFFSTTPGVRILNTVSSLLVWYVFSFSRGRNPAFGLATGTAHTLAVMGHQTNLMLLPAFLGAIWLQGEKSRVGRLKESLFYLGALTIGVLGVYGFVGRFLLSRMTFEKWTWWVFSYFHVNEWGGHFQASGFKQGQSGMVSAFLTDLWPGREIGPGLTYGELKGFLGFSVLVLLAGLVLGLGRMASRNAPSLWIGFAWLAFFVPFYIWWEPWNIEFWVSCVSPCWILMGMVVAHYAGGISSPHRGLQPGAGAAPTVIGFFGSHGWAGWMNPVLGITRQAVVVSLWAALVGLLFLYNFQGKIKDAPGRFAHKNLLAALDWKTHPRDLVVLAGTNTVPMYLDRFQKQNYLSLHSFLRRKKDHPKEAWGKLDGELKAVLKKKGRVWVLSELVDSPTVPGLIERQTGQPPGRVREFFKGYPMKPVKYRGQVYFYAWEPKAPPKTEGTGEGASPAAPPAAAPGKSTSQGPGKTKKKKRGTGAARPAPSPIPTHGPPARGEGPE